MYGFGTIEEIHAVQALQKNNPGGGPKPQKGIML